MSAREAEQGLVEVERPWLDTAGLKLNHALEQDVRL
jgi:hypothetical protein